MWSAALAFGLSNPALEKRSNPITELVPSPAEAPFTATFWHR
jgi:hypothetical protein